MNKIFIILWLSLLYAFPLFAQIQVGNDIDGEALDDRSGSAVSISADGTRVAIGAPSNDGNGSGSGYVRVFEITNALPVELIQFSARSINKGIALQWKTASETNNKGFELEKSKDAEKWEPLTFIIGKGTTTLPQVYEFLDTDISFEFNYYRLKQIDFDERFEYSEILAVVIDPLASDISFYPNPTRDKINLQIDKPKQVTVYTALGSVLDRFVLEAGDQELFLKKYGQSILLLQVGEEWLRVVVE